MLKFKNISKYLFTLLIIVSGFISFAQPAGPNSPTSFTTDDVAPDAWGSEIKGYASDGQYAMFTGGNKFDSGDVSDGLIYNGFGFAIPGGAVIDGIIVEIEKWGDGTEADVVIQLVDETGTRVGNNKADLVTDWPNADPNTYVTYGGAADLWGTTWTSTKINDPDFGIYIQVSQGTNDREAYIDHVRITVHYTAPVSGACGAGGGLLETSGNDYTICAGSTDIIQINLYEDQDQGDVAQKADIGVGNDQTIRFSIESAADYKFLDNGNLTVIATAGNNIDEASIDVRFLSDYVIEVFNIDVDNTNKFDDITIQVEVQCVNHVADLIQRCGGTMSTGTIGDGFSVATFSVGAAMSYSTVQVTQATTNDIAPGYFSGEILQYNISTTGECPAISVTDFIWTTTGTDIVADIDQAEIFYTGNSSTYNTSNSFGTAANPSGTVTITGSQALGSGNNYFWLAYDLNIAATTNKEMDATSISVTVAGTNHDAAYSSVTPTSRTVSAYFSSSSGDYDGTGGSIMWNGTACGDPAVAGFPSASTQNAIICAGHTVTTDGPELVNDILIDGILDISNNDFTIYGSINFVSGTINAGDGNVILVGANKNIFGDGSINFTGTGQLVIQEDINIDAAASITVTGTDILMDVDSKTLTNYGSLTVPNFFSGNESFRAFRNATGSTCTLTGTTHWNNKMDVHFDDGNNTLIFAATSTLNDLADVDNATFWNITVNSGVTLTMPNSVVYVKGNFLNSGILAPGTGTIDFSGSADQYINMAAGTFYKIEVANGGANEIILNSNVTVTNSLEWKTGGYIDCATNDVTFTLQNWADATSIIGTGTLNFDRFVLIDDVGKMRIEGVSNTETAHFPVGLAKGSTNYARVNVAPGTADNFEVTLCNYVNENGTCSGGIQDTDDGVNYTWNISSDAATVNANVTLYWDDANMTMTGGFDNTDCAVNHHDGTSWTVLGAFGAATNVSGNIYSRTGTTTAGFSPFGVSSGGGPLPIELLHFSAHLNGDQVDLKWATTNELNNDYFTIEKSRDGKTFEEVFTVEGAGNSSKLIEYYDVDYDVWDGKTYYRLKQTDFDGRFSYSQIVAVTYKGEGYQTMPLDNLNVNIYPNPSDGVNVHLDITGFEADKEVLVVVLDITGKEFYSKIVVSDYNGEIATVIDPYDKLPVGTYLVTGSADNRLFSKKLLVTK